MARSLRRLLLGCGFGLLVGTGAGWLDQGLRWVDPASGVGRSSLFAVCALYAVPFAIVGFLLGLRAPVRRVRAVLLPAALLLVLGGWINLRWLPSLFAPASLTFDVLAVAAAILAGRRLGRWRHGPRHSWTPAAVALVLLAGTAVFSWTAPRPGVERERGIARPEAPDLLVFLLDALRADHVGAYGYERPTTPHLDALAAEGLRFARVYAPSSWTKPSVASLFTGVLPASHHNHRHASRLPSRAPSLPEGLRAAGYETAVFAENNFVSRLFGFDRGVDHFVGLDPDVLAQTVVGHLLQQLEVRRPELASFVDRLRWVDDLDPRQRGRRGGALDIPTEFGRWLEQVDDSRPWFAYVHLMKPHAPYVCPPPFDGFFGEPSVEASPVDPPHVEGLAPFAHAEGAGDERWRQRLIANYDERLRYGDHLVGQMLERVRTRPRPRDLIVVVLADHGEEFGQNGLYDHGHSLQEGVLRVPLIVHGLRGVEAGRVIEEPVRLIDLPPTLLRLAGDAGPLPMAGRSLLELLDGPARATRPVVAEVEHGPDYWSRALVVDRAKYLHTRQDGRDAGLFFDLEGEAGETSPLEGPSLRDLQWMPGELERIRSAAPGFEAGGEATLDPATEARLRALGYLQ